MSWGTKSQVLLAKLIIIILFFIGVLALGITSIEGRAQTIVIAVSSIILAFLLFGGVPIVIELHQKEKMEADLRKQ